MVAGECPDHWAPRGTRSPRSVNEQQWRPLARAVVDHMHPAGVLNVAITHAPDGTGLPAISLGQMSAPRSVYSRRDETRPGRCARRAPAGDGVVTVIIIGLIGLRTQWSSNVTFGSGGVADDIALFVWGVAAFVTGKTLSDFLSTVVSR